MKSLRFFIAELKQLNYFFWLSKKINSFFVVWVDREAGFLKKTKELYWIISKLYFQNTYRKCRKSLSKFHAYVSSISYNFLKINQFFKIIFLVSKISHFIALQDPNWCGIQCSIQLRYSYKKYNQPYFSSSIFCT